MSLEYWLVEHTLNRDCNRSGTNTIIKTQTLCRSTYHMSLSQCPLCYHPYHPRKKFHPPPQKKFFFDPPSSKSFVVGGGLPPPAPNPSSWGVPKWCPPLEPPPQELRVPALGLNYMIIFEHLKRYVLVVSTQNEGLWKILSLVLVSSTSLVRNLSMSSSNLSMVRMRGKVSYQVFQLRFSQIDALTSIQQEI